MTVTYCGFRVDGVIHVRRGESAFEPGPSQAIRNHSPDGFNWGYGGSGPAQLALALLYDATGDRETAEQYYQDFKWAQVSSFGESWQITREWILSWLNNWKGIEARQEVIS